MLTSLKYSRPDGTFVGIVNGMEYHVIPSEPYWPAALELAAIEMPPLEPAFVPPPITMADIRAERDSLLRASDWTSLPDATPAGGRAAWLEYRQALRDITNGLTDPATVVWPSPPTQRDPE